MKIDEFKGKKVAVLGFGVEGQSSASFFLRHGLGVSVFDTAREDKFEQEKIKDFEKKGVKFKFEKYPKSFQGFDLLVRSPGISTDSTVIAQAVKENVIITSSTKIFFDLCPCPIIGVTGTKGKSTTSALIYEMLKKQGKDVYLGGNIGNSPLDFLESLKPDSWVVLELSSFQLQDLTKSPQISVFLMVTNEHLDYHQDIRDYVDAKRNILRFQSQSDYAILNQDYPASNESDVHTEAQIYHVSRERDAKRGCYVCDGLIIIKPDGVAASAEGFGEARELKVIPTADILLPGKHNFENACAATMAAYLAGVEIPNIASVLKEFRGLEHRLEFIGERLGIRFYNDSLATVPEATIEAIEALGKDVETLIAGGYDRGLDYTTLGRFIANSPIKTLILFPTTGEKIWEEVSKIVPNERMRPQKYDVSSMKEAVLIASEVTARGKICLMSPGASSFNLFKNYKDRGDQFRQAVMTLARPR